MESSLESIALNMLVNGDFDVVVSNHPASGHSQKSHGRGGRGSGGKSGGGGGRGEDVPSDASGAISDKQQRSNQKQYLKRTFGLEKGDFNKDHKINSQGLAKIKEKVPELNYGDMAMLPQLDLFNQNQYIRSKMTGGKARKVKRKEAKVEKTKKVEKSTTESEIPAYLKDETADPIKRMAYIKGQEQKRLEDEKKGIFKPPLGISYEGEPTEFSKSVWKEIGPHGTEDFEKVKKVGSMMREKMYRDNPKIKEKMDSLKQKIALNKKMDIETEAFKNEIFSSPNYLPHEYLKTEKGKKTFVKFREAGTKAGELRNEITDLTRDVGADIAKATPKTIGQVRSMGWKGDFITDGSSQTGSTHGNKAQKKKLNDSLNRVKEKMPADWNESARNEQIEFIITDRGYYSPKSYNQSGVVAVSGSTMEKRDSVMIHELTHSRQHRKGVITQKDYPPPKGTPYGEEVKHHERKLSRLAKIENDFLVSRTKGEKSTTIYTNKDGTKEVGFEDKFKEHYMGRQYGGLHSTREVATMGVQGVLTNKWDMAADSEYLDLTLGILASQ